MALKTVFLPYQGVHVKFGRIAPPAPPALWFRNYLAQPTLQPLPAPPASVDYSPKAMVSLSNIFGNDALGDCVIAAGAHCLGVWTGNAGQIYVPNTGQIINEYTLIGGYIPGRPATDNGCDEESAFRYWMSSGMADGSKLAGWLAIDATNSTLVKQAINLFENCYFGVAMPDAWVANMGSMRSGFTWDVAGSPDPSNGHAFNGVGYTAAGVTIDTWAMLGTVTWAAVARYATLNAGGALYTLLNANILNQAQAKSPNGLDWAALIADFNAMGGHIVAPPAPPPGPTPPQPVPTPTPTPPPPSPTPSPVPVPVPVPSATQGWWDATTHQVHLPAGWTQSPAHGPMVVIHPIQRRVEVPWNFTVV